MGKKGPIVLSMQKSFKILKYHLKLEFWALKKILISYVFVSEVGLIPVQPGLNPVQGGPIVVHPGLDSVLSRVSSTDFEIVMGKDILLRKPIGGDNIICQLGTHLTGIDLPNDWDFQFSKSFQKNIQFCLGIELGFIVEPKDTNIAPSFAESSTSLIFCGILLKLPFLQLDLT